MSNISEENHTNTSLSIEKEVPQVSQQFTSVAEVRYLLANLNSILPAKEEEQEVPPPEKVAKKLSF